MGDFGYSVPSPGAPAPRPPQISLWTIFAAVLVMLGMAAAVAYLLLRDGGPTGPSYPKAWDARIAPYVKIAEKQRGLYFQHPVHVRFLPPAEFRKTVTVEEQELDEDDLEDLEETAGLLRAVGLVKGEVDLVKATNQVSGEGTLAYYSFEDQRITVRGLKVTPAMRSTLVHELVHVLQDQHFEIGKRFEELGEQDENAETSEASVLRAIVEGDARRVEASYRETLSRKNRRALDRGAQADYEQASQQLKDVPKVLVTMFAAPYQLGEPLLQLVAEDGGNNSVNRLFRDAPAHESSLLDPLEVMAGEDGAKQVEVPGLEDGDEQRSAGEFGALTWYLMLAERMPVREALAATDGWGGDSYVAFRRGERTCARMAFVGDTAKDTKRMTSALRRWSAAAPGAGSRVTQSGGQVQVESCDPGTKAKVGSDASEEAVTLAAIRATLALQVVQQGAGEPMARCYADRVVDTFSVAQLTNPTFGRNDPSVTNEFTRLAASCR